jgi:hypothetical protein
MREEISRIKGCEDDEAVEYLMQVNTIPYFESIFSKRLHLVESL